VIPALLRGRLAAVIVLAALALGSCAGTDRSSPPPPTTSTGGSFPPSPVAGVVVHIDSSGLSNVHGFDLRLTDGTVLAFSLGPLDNGAAFPPGHLAEHQATGAPVLVSFRIVDGAPLVYRLEDAPP
jgi:hypothetical protein